MNNQTQPTQFLLYKSENGHIKIDVLIQDETVWLTQEQMSELFGRDRTVITKHIKNIFNEGELEEKSNVQNLHFAHSDKPIKHYNLDVIISVGYRVKSLQGTRFRQWATQHLKEFIIKGFTMDDERLKDPRQIFGKDYFDEQLERIRDVRSSERKLYQKITDIYAMYMRDWIAKLDAFLQFNEKEVLEHKGKISHEVAVALALDEYKKYRIIQDETYISDFDKLLLEMEEKNE
ncbi:MAG: RhuM family protein [Campylobacterota bacterium]|nr:RhuM family protein [Campylobacterota bacterium]